MSFTIVFGEHNHPWDEDDEPTKGDWLISDELAKLLWEGVHYALRLFYNTCVLIKQDGKLAGAVEEEYTMAFLLSKRLKEVSQQRKKLDYLERMTGIEFKWTKDGLEAFDMRINNPWWPRQEENKNYVLLQAVLPKGVLVKTEVNYELSTNDRYSDHGRYLERHEGKQPAGYKWTISQKMWERYFDPQLLINHPYLHQIATPATTFYRGFYKRLRQECEDQIAQLEKRREGLQEKIAELPPLPEELEQVQSKPETRQKKRKIKNEVD